jgi:hypothetical protein
MKGVSFWGLLLLKDAVWGILAQVNRGVAQLVARTAGGREVAGSSPVTPTKISFNEVVCLR